MKQDIKAHSGCRCPKSTILGFPETVSESEPMTRGFMNAIFRSRFYKRFHTVVESRILMVVKYD